MKGESKRQKQVAGLIQREFSQVLQTTGTFIYGSEPLVTVTRVRMTSDFGIAYIYLSVYNTLYKQEVIKLLWENVYKLRGDLGKRVRKQMRRVPKLKFFIDDTLDQVERLDQLFDQIDTGNEHRSMKDVLDEQKRQNEEE